MAPRTLAVVLAVASVVACGKAAVTRPSWGGGPPAASAPASPPSADWDLKTRMAVHFIAARAMRDALARGDLDTYRAAATEVVKEGEHGVWWGRSEGLREAALHATSVQTLGTAADALAKVGEACGGCHLEVKRPPIKVTDAPPPLDAAGMDTSRHRWAAARLWDGLVGPSDEAWVKASAVLSDAPLVVPALFGNDPDLQARALGIAVRVHALGHRAKYSNPVERLRVFAEIHTTCAECHALVRRP